MSWRTLFWNDQDPAHAGDKIQRPFYVHDETSAAMRAYMAIRLPR